MYISEQVTFQTIGVTAISIRILALDKSALYITKGVRQGWIFHLFVQNCLKSVGRLFHCSIDHARAPSAILPVRALVESWPLQPTCPVAGSTRLAWAARLPSSQNGGRIV